jgi:hypothetical protein
LPCQISCGVEAGFAAVVLDAKGGAVGVVDEGLHLAGRDVEALVLVDVGVDRLGHAGFPPDIDVTDMRHGMWRRRRFTLFHLFDKYIWKYISRDSANARVLAAPRFARSW